MPAEAEEKIEEYMAELNEQVAETDEALMEKFFMEEPFTEEELPDRHQGRHPRPQRHARLLRLRLHGSRHDEPAVQPRASSRPTPSKASPWRRLTKRATTKEFKVDPNGSPMVFVFNTLC